MDDRGITDPFLFGGCEMVLHSALCYMVRKAFTALVRRAKLVFVLDRESWK